MKQFQNYQLVTLSSESTRTYGSAKTGLPTGPTFRLPGRGQAGRDRTCFVTYSSNPKGASSVEEF